MNENIKLYREACKGKDWQSIKLTELAQRAQEDFYGRWIQEMSRIAKVRLFPSSARLFSACTISQQHLNVRIPSLVSQ